MAKRFNEELMRKKGLECLMLLDESGLDLIEQYTVVEAMLDTMRKTMALYALFGDRLDGIVEKLVKADAADAVEEAEDILKGEM